MLDLTDENLQLVQRLEERLRVTGLVSHCYIQSCPQTSVSKCHYNILTGNYQKGLLRGTLVNVNVLFDFTVFLLLNAVIKLLEIIL